MDVLLAAARLECACADADISTPELSDLALRAAAFYLGTEGRPDRAVMNAAMRALPPPATNVRLAALEGIRFYALEPAGYASAARQWRSQQGAKTAWVLGLRSMGSVLGPVAAVALQAAGCRARLVTLRPMGAPQNRKLVLRPALRHALANWPGAFVIVDEGPGLSGSSFGSAVRVLQQLGVAGHRIALLTQWAPNAAQSTLLSNAYASRHWHEWRVHAAAPLGPPAADAYEISGGVWREALRRHRDVPVWPAHERRKFLCDGGKTLAKFAGFGAYGRATRARAAALARAGWGTNLADREPDTGWIFYRRKMAVPLRRPEARWCEFAGRYLAWVASEFRLGGPDAPSPELREMLRANLERLAGRAAPSETPEGPRVALDGRMPPWEWGRTRHGWVKFDGTDHGDDPFFPGPADIAWDLAGIEVEFGRAVGRAIREAYQRASGEAAAALQPRLAWHRLAYAAFRAAWCSLAARHTDAPDSTRFTRLAARYRRCLGGSPSLMTAAPGGAMSWNVLGAGKG